MKRSGVNILRRDITVFRLQASRQRGNWARNWHVWSDTPPYRGINDGFAKQKLKFFAEPIFRLL
jgi:hypothetical protein